MYTKEGNKMNNNVKNEFKDFINTLSTEICKQVLVDDMKKINEEFNKTSKNYKTLSNEYSNNINGIKEQFNQVQNTNRLLNQFVVNMNNNANSVNTALDVIAGSHRKVIDKILEDNQKLLNLYSTKIQSLNEKQKEQFISALVSSQQSQSEKYLAELKQLVDGNRTNKILEDIDIIASKIETVYSKVKQNENTILDVETKILNQWDKKMLMTIRDLNKEFGDIYKRVDQNNYDIKELKIKVDNKNNIIIMLSSIIIIFCMVLLFK
jgi:uncharacterized protein YlxP (DUF503 family)